MIFDQVLSSLRTFELTFLDRDRACLEVITNLGEICCPHNDDPKLLIWPVRVRELDTPQSKLQASQLDRELVFHTDCSYEHNTLYLVALYVVQSDRTEDGGKFHMVRTQEVIDKLSTKTKRLLRDETYRKTNVSLDFCKGNIDYICGSILLDGDRSIRYRRDIINKDRLKEESLEKQAAIAEYNSIILTEDQLNISRPRLDNNMMVLFNNQHFLHVRTKIQDRELYLLRVRF